MRIAVLGTGMMGAPMARAAHAGHGREDRAATIVASRPA